eukprot:2778258-Pyramimonas_sp.AAC.1
MRQYSVEIDNANTMKRQHMKYEEQPTSHYGILSRHQMRGDKCASRFVVCARKLLAQIRRCEGAKISAHRRARSAKLHSL